MLKFFDSNSGCFAKYEAFCSHIFNNARFRRKAYSYRRGSKYRKIVCIKIILENGWWEDGGTMHIPYPTPLDSPLAISYRNHQKNLAYFCHLAPLVMFFFAKRQSQKGGGSMAQLPRS